MDAAALLEALKQLRPSQVYASRRGICGGISKPGVSFVFRRNNGQIRFEQWPTSGSSEQTVIVRAVPSELLKRVGDWLDSL